MHPAVMQTANRQANHKCSRDLMPYIKVLVVAAVSSSKAANDAVSAITHDVATQGTDHILGVLKCIADIPM